MNHLFIDSTSDPFAADIPHHRSRFAADISHHRSYWTEHILRNLNKRLEDSHFQNINIDDAKKMLFRHVDETIFRNREFFFIWVFFHEHSQITGLQGKG